MDMVGFFPIKIDRACPSSCTLFFDGGVTQKALENQAIQQLANEEGDIMAYLSQVS